MVKFWDLRRAGILEKLRASFCIKQKISPHTAAIVWIGEEPIQINTDYFHDVLDGSTASVEAVQKELKS